MFSVRNYMRLVQSLTSDWGDSVRFVSGRRGHTGIHVSTRLTFLVSNIYRNVLLISDLPHAALSSLVKSFIRIHSSNWRRNSLLVSLCLGSRRMDA